MVRTEGSVLPVNVWKQPNSSSTEASSSSSPSPVADSPQQDKVDSVVRRRPQRKKPVSTGVWPCKIHGCNKQFAREADLKRHQRTTKMHSMPSFSCPQCDATFTRTDALRRHQKSRHNGVVLDLVDQTKDRDENTRSRSGTPSSSKSKEKVESHPVPVTQGDPTHTGPSSYYRSHTANISPYIPPHLQQLSSDSQITLPIPSTRTGPPWPAYLSIWPNGPLPYLPHPIYQPSPHYRPHTTSYSPPRPHSDVTTLNSSSQISTDPTSMLQSLENELEPGGITREKEITAEDVVAAVEAALRQAACQSQRSESQLDTDGGEQILSPADSLGTGLGRHMEDELMGLNVLSDYGTTLEASGDLEHILTVDGEPMLNPAELLTQESLASPPPS